MRQEWGARMTNPQNASGLLDMTGGASRLNACSPALSLANDCARLHTGLNLGHSLGAPRAME
jgi:hypothetical protein